MTLCFSRAIIASDSAGNEDTLYGMLFSDKEKADKYLISAQESITMNLKISKKLEDLKEADRDGETIFWDDL